MKLNQHQERALRMIAQRPRVVRDLTHFPSLDLANLSAPIVQMYLDDMEEGGYVLRIGEQYAIAPKGRDYLEQLDAEKAKYAREKPQLYTGPKYNLRPGSQDHLKHSSKGLG